MTSRDPSPPAEDSPQSLIALGNQARRDERLEAAHHLYEKSLKLARKTRDKRAIARALLALADNAMWFLPPGASNGLRLRERLAKQALGLFRKLGDEKGIADALWMQAASDLGPKSEPLLEESLSIYRRIDDLVGISRTLFQLGNRAFMTGDHELAAELKSEALQIARQSGDKAQIAAGLFSRGIGFEGSNRDRRAPFEEAQAIYRELAMKGDLVRALQVCEQLACDDDDWDRRESYLTEALDVSRQLGSEHLLATSLERLAEIARSRGDEARAESLEAECRELELN